MDLRRFAVALVILVGGLGVLVYTNRPAANPATSPQTALAQASAQPADAPSGAPASAAPAATAQSAPVAPKAPASPAPTESGASEGGATLTAASGPAEKWFGQLPPAAQSATLGSLEDPNGYLMQVQLTANGASIYTAKMSQYFATVADKQLYHADPAHYEQRRLADPAKYKGHVSILNPVPGDGGQVLPLATKAVGIEFAGETGSYQYIDILDSKAWVLEEASADSARYAYTFYRGASWDQARNHPVIKLTKTYTLPKRDYTVSVSLKVENLSSRAVKVTLNQRGPTGLPSEDPRADNRAVAYGLHKVADGKVQVVLNKADQLAKMTIGAENALGKSDANPPVLWLGHVDKFFGSMLYLKPETTTSQPAGAPPQLAATGLKAEFYDIAEQESPTSRTFATGVKIPDLLLEPGQAGKEVRFELFVGPKKRDLFTNPDYPYYKAIYQQLDYIGTIDFGSCCTWAPLTFGMMWLLDKLSIISLGNYGVAIILLVFMVRLVLHPLTKKSQVSMSKMQKLAPQMKKLQEKYADDKNTLNKEMMGLYKQQGFTPILGCLPTVLQMPIWIALYTALSATVELRHAGFLPFWITDLAGPDALFTWSDNLPYIGHTFNLLPLLLTVAMYLQMKMTPQMTPAAPSPEQQKQQKMMQYMMPVMMLFFFYTAPSGLTLYIMASTASSVVEQWVIRKHIQEKEAQAAAIETTVTLSGKTFRTARTKKPKGPFWTKRG
ncbi:MAG: YidC/Oxa1 family insertase periplasmic-domain containing protein [Phycisphaerae bacterium]